MAASLRGAQVRRFSPPSWLWLCVRSRPACAGRRLVLLPGLLVLRLRLALLLCLFDPGQGRVLLPGPLPLGLLLGRRLGLRPGLGLARAQDALYPCWRQRSPPIKHRASARRAVASSATATRDDRGPPQPAVQQAPSPDSARAALFSLLVRCRHPHATSTYQHVDLQDCYPARRRNWYVVHAASSHCFPHEALLESGKSRQSGCRCGVARVPHSRRALWLG